MQIRAAVKVRFGRLIKRESHTAEIITLQLVSTYIFKDTCLTTKTYNMYILDHTNTYWIIMSIC